ncbi:MAG: cation transporter, partial [Flavobacteriales bacterium]|nr:cation transporter [Flavobacteriales bacterium]
MKISEFEITKMDCPSEENLIRMKLDGIPEIKGLEFDIPNRKLNVIHTDNLEKIEESIHELDLGGRLIESKETDNYSIEDSSNQKRLLWSVLAINFIFFIIEMTTGLISKSMGLIADSLDMLADSFVYGLSLLAVGGSQSKKKTIAKLAGYFQIILAIIGFIEVIRRFIGQEALPDFKIMIVISILALIANGICLFLLQKSKSNEAHMKASMIFTSNDVIINLGVILAGGLVLW